MPDFSKGPLNGIRVVDLTTVVMGPYATHILGDLGADVIKVEGPTGDSTRSHKPGRNAAMPGVILNLHRNKRSVVLDLKAPEGREALKRIVATADVFIHNMRPRAIEALGFGYEQVRACKDDIVYCAAYGFGAAGPYRNKAAYDDLIQAGSGLAGMYGKVHGAPTYVPAVVCDKVGGLTIAWSVLAALVQRAQGGGGQSIEVPMFETAIEFNMIEQLTGSAFDPPIGPMGFPRVMTPRRKPFPTKDGHACILPYSDRNWADFFDFVGRPDLKDDPRTRTLADRIANSEFVYGVIEEAAPSHTSAEWVAFCDRVSIPCMPVIDFENMADDPHVAAVGMLRKEEHPSEGRYNAVRMAPTFGGAPFAIRRHAPRFGEHSEEILAEAGLSSEDIDALIERGIAVAERAGRREVPRKGGAVD